MEISGQLHAWPLYTQGKSPFERRLGGLQSQSGHSIKDKNSLPLLEIKSQLSSL